MAKAIVNTNKAVGNGRFFLFFAITLSFCLLSLYITSGKKMGQEYAPHKKGAFFHEVGEN
jgi:hypothetical protein